MAWHPLGWIPVGFAEIDAFPSAVLAHHYGSNMPGEPLSKNGIPNHGDFTKIKASEVGPIDLLVGGTPCQSFSIAGLRGGMADSRGNLALEYLRLADRTRPRWLVWENVPGVLSSGRGRDFGAILGGMVELGYGFAYRVLDAQFIRIDGFGRAVPQRRRRVFVVGYLGDWRRAAAVLFERYCLSGHPTPRRQAGERVAPSTSVGASGCRQAFGGNNGSGPIDVATETFVAHALRGEGFDASEDGTGRGTPIIPLLEIGKGSSSRGDGPNGAGLGEIGDPMFTLQAGAQHGVAVAYRTNRDNGAYETGDRTDALTTSTDPCSHVVAFDMRGREGGAQFEGPHETANIRASSGGSSRSYIASWAIRRLTPLECERLQGFPDGFTAIPYRGKPASDGPRYKALGNSMACNAMRWIGRRIEMVEALGLEDAA